MAIEAIDLIKQACAQAGITPELIRDHFEMIDRTNAGGRVWENGQAKDDKHAVLFQFLGDKLPGDVEVYMVPTVADQPFRHVTVNRNSMHYVSSVMIAKVFVAALADELVNMAEKHGFLACSSDECMALTPGDADRCRVCGAPLATDDDEIEEPEEEEPAGVAADPLRGISPATLAAPIDSSTGRAVSSSP